MASKADRDSQWKKLLEQLPDVMNAELRRDENGGITEIHILAGSDRSPKQIARDVQSALMAKYKVEIDHRVISVAQIPSQEDKRGSGPRILLGSVSMTLNGTECLAEVNLNRGELQYRGNGRGELTRQGRYRAIAFAAVEALSSMLPDGDLLALDELHPSQLGGRDAVFVCLTLRCDGRAEQLFGCCADADDGGLSAARAVLSAANRRIGLLV